MLLISHASVLIAIHARLQSRLAVTLAEVELTKVAPDEYVHFGDVLQLVHVETSAMLACDPSDTVSLLHVA
jgi:hypothetical protein